MAKAKQLTPGAQAKSPTAAELTERHNVLRATILKYLPDFARACEAPVDLLTIHQDAFAANCDDDEYMLLGMAIKYAGLTGQAERAVMIVGRNDDTFVRGS